MDRRLFLTRGAALLGCSAAAHPMLSTMTLASAPWDTRLVVLILRGAMDGLDLVQPVGDPHFADLRGVIADRRDAAPLPLDGYFAAHPGLAPLMPLWAKGELGFVHATSTPYRDKRSHFDGQDLLEAGTAMDAALVRDGWLNRMLQTVPGLDATTAYAIGARELKVLAGAAPVANWSPDMAMTLSPQMRLLLEQVYHDDPLFRDTALEAMALTDLAELNTDTARGAALAERAGRRGRRTVDTLAAFAAERLFDEARIASFSLSGWDTHRDQGRSMNRAVEDLASVIDTLRTGLGPIWQKTAIVAMTEFGRTVRANGTGGTDHGTGGAMVLAGGAVRGGRVHGRWPGLGESDLYDRRDLMPTSDVRAHAAWMMRWLFGLDRATLEGTVFPGLDMGRDTGLLI